MSEKMKRLKDGNFFSGAACGSAASTLIDTFHSPNRKVGIICAVVFLLISLCLFCWANWNDEVSA